MRGWTAVQHDDAIGRELHLYVTDPPSRMEGSAKQDNIVRRGDAILGWIDEGIWLARQNRRVDKSNRALMKDKTQQQFGPNGRTYGDGVSDDPRPRERSAPGFISPKRLAEYRERAKGTITDSQIVTPGRRMLDPYEPQGE
jgi:hypothetical protein